MYQLIVWFCFVALAIVDQHTNNFGWVSYDNMGPAPLGRLEYIEHSCQSCAKSSADTNLAVKRMTRRLDNASHRCLLCEEVSGKLKTLKEIHNTTESTANTIKRVKNTVDSVAEDVKAICKGVFETKKETEKISGNYNVIEGKIERHTTLVEEINSKLGFLVSAKENEQEEIKKQWALYEEMKKYLEERTRTVEAQHQKVIQKEENLQVREREAETKLREAKEKENWVKEQHAVIEEEKRYLETVKKSYQEKRKKVEDGASLLASAVAAFLVLLIIVVVVMFCRQYRSWAASESHLKVALDKNRPLPDAKIDVCHLSMTRERRTFFERVIQPRLAALNIRPYMEYCLLHQPSDFNSIPKAKAYIVHWASQRRSIFSGNWTHRGLLRALGRKPFFIMVCDQDQTEPMPDGVVYDTSFSQIQSEPELREAVTANCLLTYPRGVDNLSRAQEQVLVNWLNANIGEGAFAGEFVS